MPPQPPPPQEPPESVTFSKFTGVKNTVTRERLTPEEFERALNIDLDDAGQIHRRRGYIKRISGNVHSLMNMDDNMFAVVNGELCKINPDFSTVSLGVSMGYDPVAYQEMGEDLYFTSKQNSGIIRKNLSIDPWGYQTPTGAWLSPVLDPSDTYFPIAGRLLSKTPRATSMTYWNGRLYLAVGNLLWATELYNYNYVDKTRNFKQFEEDITCLGTVTDGIYVGTDSNMWFLSGTFTQMQRILITDDGVLSGSLIEAPAELINPLVPFTRAHQTESKGAVLFLTEFGLCAGMDSGVTYNLTEDKCLFPKAQNVAAMFRRQDGVNSYVAVMDSGGTPANAARIGDYVDAELVRLGGL